MQNLMAFLARSVPLRQAGWEVRDRVSFARPPRLRRAARRSRKCCPMKLFSSLLLLLPACYAACAASVLLYETGWETAPADPAWTAGNLIPQNGWFGDPADSNDRNKVVANDTADANPFGSPVMSPSGSQFHRFRASSSTSAQNQQYAWPDLSGAFAARPSGNDVLTGSIDVFVPSGDSADGSLYGLLGFDFDSNTANYFLDYGFLVVPNSRTIRLVVDAADTAQSPAGIFPYDTWFNVAVQVNYQSGDIVVLYNGAPVPGLTTNFSFIVGSSFTDLDLFSQNSLNAPTSRIIFSDNYRVTVDSLIPPNDNFSDALPLTGVSGQVRGSNAGATAEAGEPDHALQFATASVWYT